MGNDEGDEETRTTATRRGLLAAVCAFTLGGYDAPSIESGDGPSDPVRGAVRGTTSIPATRNTTTPSVADSTTTPTTATTRTTETTRTTVEFDTRFTLEASDIPDAAEFVRPPVRVSARIDPGDDVDWFRFRARAGQTIRIWPWITTVPIVWTVFTDDELILTYPLRQILVPVPRTGDYLLRVESQRNRTGRYVLEIRLLDRSTPVRRRRTPCCDP